MPRLRRHITYANVASTTALVLALGMGGAYAVDRIGSPQIRDNSIRSVDLRDGKAVRGADVKPNSLGRKQVNERSLVATEIAPVERVFELECFLENDFGSCATASVALPRRGRVLAIATGALVTTAEGDEGVKAECQFESDGTAVSTPVIMGETADTTDTQQGEGFAHTFLSPGLLLSPGEYELAFACRALDGDVLLENVSIVAVALTSRN